MTNYSLYVFIIFCYWKVGKLLGFKKGAMVFWYVYICIPRTQQINPRQTLNSAEAARRLKAGTGPAPSNLRLHYDAVTLSVYNASAARPAPGRAPPQ